MKSFLLPFSESQLIQFTSKSTNRICTGTGRPLKGLSLPVNVDQLDITLCLFMLRLYGPVNRAESVECGQFT